MYVSQIAKCIRLKLECGNATMLSLSDAGIWPLRDLWVGESMLSDAGIPSRDRQIVHNISFPVYSGI